MASNHLEKFMEFETADGQKIPLSIDPKTRALYIDGEQVVTAYRLERTERFQAWCITLSTMIIAVCSVTKLFHELRLFVI